MLTKSGSNMPNPKEKYKNAADFFWVMDLLFQMGFVTVAGILYNLVRHPVKFPLMVVRIWAMFLWDVVCYLALKLRNKLS